MASFIVMEPARADPDAAGPVLVRDGFHFFAFLLPVFWLLWHRLWLEAAVAFAVLAALVVAGELAGLGLAASFLSLLVSIYAGLEAGALRIAALRRRGWLEWGVVEAESVSDAEARYCAETGRYEDEAPPAVVAWQGGGTRPAPARAAALGLVPVDGAR